MIMIMDGSIFDSKAWMITNPVNCVGIMGAGLAFQFKSRFPSMFREYEQRCHKGRTKLGEVQFVFSKGRNICLFPTKGHWNSPSKISDIKNGLSDLLTKLEEISKAIKTFGMGPPSIALPALGCGHGQLKWSDVRPMIETTFSGYQGVVEIYGPHGQPRLF